MRQNNSGLDSLTFNNIVFLLRAVATHSGEYFQKTGAAARGAPPSPATARRAQQSHVYERWRPLYSLQNESRLSPCELALALPVSIHCREAWDDLHAMLRDPVLARDCDHVS
jgi:hypothetical protein